MLPKSVTKLGKPIYRRKIIMIISGLGSLRIVKKGNLSKLLVTWLSLRQAQTLEKWESSTITIGTSLISEIHFNWQLWKQGICWSVSRDHIACSGLEEIEVTRFVFFFLKAIHNVVLTFDQISGSSTVVTLGPTGQVQAKAKLGHTLTPDALLTFRSAYSSHNDFWHIA